MPKIKVYTDGASRGNPGAAGIGIVIYDEKGTMVESYHKYIGETTNNQAEYKALLKSVEIIKELIKAGTQIEKIDFYLDSELVVKQVKGEYKVKDAGLSPLYKQFIIWIKMMAVPYTITHIKRALNKAADELANKGIDEALKPNPTGLQA